MAAQHKYASSSSHAARKRGRLIFLDWPSQLLHVSVDGEEGRTRILQFYDIDVPRPDSLEQGDVIEFDEDDAHYGAAHPTAVDVVRIPT